MLGYGNQQSCLVEISTPYCPLGRATSNGENAVVQEAVQDETVVQSKKAVEEAAVQEDVSIAGLTKQPRASEAPTTPPPESVCAPKKNERVSKSPDAPRAPEAAPVPTPARRPPADQLARTPPQYTTLGKKLGAGAFGAVYESSYVEFPDTSALFRRARTATVLGIVGPLKEPVVPVADRRRSTRTGEHGMLSRVGSFLRRWGLQSGAKTPRAEAPRKPADLRADFPQETVTKVCGFLRGSGQRATNREVAALARLDHPNIPALIGIEEVVSVGGGGLRGDRYVG